MYIIYNLLVIILFPFIVIGLLFTYRLRFAKYFFIGINERLGMLSLPAHTASQPALWLHASSVGELNMLKPLIAELKTRYLSHHIYLSTVTPEALEIARQEKLADVVFFAPLDISFIARKVIRRIRPQLLLLAESEFWPSLIIQSKKIGAKVGVVNARISDRAFRWMEFLSWWYRYLFSYIDFFGARTVEDKERIIALGVEKDRVELTGNIKYDTVQIQSLLPDKMEQIYKKLYLRPQQMVFVCGSIHPDESAYVLDAYQEAKKTFPTLSVVLAPRHIEKVPAIVKTAKNMQIPVRLQSQASRVGNNHFGPCLILDTIGDLIDTYRIATVVFVGGSLVRKGGQNIIEPALLEKPVIFGPHMNNFKFSAHELLRCGGAVQVKHAKELVYALTHLLSEYSLRMQIARRALSAASGLKGGSMNTVRLIRKILD